jgi:hypothetical protein
MDEFDLAVQKFGTQLLRGLARNKRAFAISAGGTPETWRND